MPRRRRRRWVRFLPPETFFKPAGIPLRELEEIHLSVEELEALRLKDLEGLDQEACAAQMGISRTTFQRVLYAARSKITEALVKGKAIRIEGGDFELPAARMFKCAVCGYEFEVPFGTGQRGMDLACPNCGKGPVHRFNGGGPGGGPGGGQGGRQGGPGKSGPGRGRQFRGGQR
ncbi:MAG: DUF134 domain-containing protein [Bacillota bacterium]|nr:DUF134 domain-containing protein [Bacillota bacterium]